LKIDLLLMKATAVPRVRSKVPSKLAPGIMEVLKEDEQKVEQSKRCL